MWLHPRSRRPLTSRSAGQEQEVLAVGVSSGRRVFALSAALEAAGGAEVATLSFLFPLFSGSFFASGNHETKKNEKNGHRGRSSSTIGTLNSLLSLLAHERRRQKEITGKK